ncbi:MAG: adenylate/guanylate cyclase domain-containing protein [Chthonomonadales bacterium]|nr:adenylate/guanylate cyclase domain-containing protein [Chthonomonadales bacterium]
MTASPHKPPEGIVTFLFTDIVGSTDMWETHGDAFLPVLQAHNAIMADAIERNGGHLMKTEGDSYKVAFSDPAAAVRCAIVAQAALQRYPWPADIDRLQVRMAVHTGKPFAQGGDYFGPPVNRTARMMSACNGGQILISEDTLDLVEHRMGKDTRFVDQGYHRLRDLDEPIRMFQVDHPALEVSRPQPPRSLNGHAHNLPIQRTSFIGRQEQIEHIAALLSRADAPCLQISGPSGIGKTRLSLQVAAERVDWFPDGVWYVRLSESSDAEEAAAEVARAVGIEMREGAAATQVVREWVSKRSCLLILDDCGRIPEVSRFIHELLSGSTNLRCLATTAESLKIENAEEIPLPELSLPPADAGAEDVMASEAGRLFAERAHEARPDFRLTDRRAKPIARLLQSLGGMPAAIERAAEMLRSQEVTPTAILSAIGAQLSTASAEETGHSAATHGRGLLGKLAESRGMASLLETMGAALADRRALTEAEHAARDALTIYDRLGDREGVASSLRRLGLVAAAQRNHEKAAALLHAARDAYLELDKRIAARIDSELEAIREALGAHVELPTPTLAQAVALATGPTSPRMEN